jgi:hypothetical protein
VLSLRTKQRAPWLSKVFLHVNAAEVSLSRRGSELKLWSMPDNGRAAHRRPSCGTFGASPGGPRTAPPQSLRRHSFYRRPYQYLVGCGAPVSYPGVSEADMAGWEETSRPGWWCARSRLRGLSMTAHEDSSIKPVHRCLSVANFDLVADPASPNGCPTASLRRTLQPGFLKHCSPYFLNITN